MEDEGGQVYYYNEATGESRWEQPEEEEVLPEPKPNLGPEGPLTPARTLIPNANPDPNPSPDPIPRGRAPPS